jgi:hypothetical protein
MTDPNDTAFVIPDCGHTDHHHCSGLTKREYFAAMAMQGILANLHTYEKGKYSREGVQVTPSATLLAVDLSDALISELNKEPLK